MELVADIISWPLLIAGTAFAIIGGVGMIRLPDLFSRMHAAGIVDTIAIALIALGLMIQAGPTLVTVKLIIILLFVFITSPTSTHALAKAALHGKLRPVVVAPKADKSDKQDKSGQGDDEPDAKAGAGAGAGSEKKEPAS